MSEQIFPIGQLRCNKFQRKTRLNNKLVFSKAITYLCFSSLLHKFDELLFFLLAKCDPLEIVIEIDCINFHSCLKEFVLHKIPFFNRSLCRFIVIYEAHYQIKDSFIHYSLELQLLPIKYFT